MAPYFKRNIPMILCAQKHDFKLRRVNKVDAARKASKSGETKTVHKEFVDFLPNIKANIRSTRESISIIHLTTPFIGVKELIGSRCCLKIITRGQCDMLCTNANSKLPTTKQKPSNNARWRMREPFMGQKPRQWNLTTGILPAYFTRRFNQTSDHRRYKVNRAISSYDRTIELTIYMYEFALITGKLIQDNHEAQPSSIKLKSDRWNKIRSSLKNLNVTIVKPAPVIAVAFMAQ
ncbi:hypothetical protein OSB04_024129 [Centaurea solstitialis]|uniref:Uncharacterized protein n=1 Tax=Centaurea solstitialis TaxID=347529 RepID=A0AA38T3Z8_9ASTR|nr:hypothetical protein OSB04_024129 [Centaurea solstitialis]